MEKRKEEKESMIGTPKVKYTHENRKQKVQEMGHKVMRACEWKHLQSSVWVCIGIQNPRYITNTGLPPRIKANGMIERKKVK